ncbi:hypothetical protein CRUP_029806 [Coryphaenoides rupestris]|nr:hypothetical protein CRUP_029806 [Coryphaenoides rupestris]
MANERNKKILLEMVKQPANSMCADCGSSDSDWVSFELGVFVCLQCSGFHRNLSSRVKSIRLDFWEDALVELMKSKGNAVAKEHYEKRVPPYYYQPQEHDCAVLREQWIRAKYERLEFIGKMKYPPLSYTTGFIEGKLWKKGKENSTFLKRKFVLSEREFTLVYYNKEDESKGPKAVIPVKHLNASFQPEKIGRPHGLQLTYLKDKAKVTRNLFVYHENAEVIVTWFNAIRAARYAYLKSAYPTGRDEQLIPKITRDYLKEGYMEKTGPLYAEELGAVFIGTATSGYAAREFTPKSARGNKWKSGILLVTPHREFVFMCEQERDQKQWLDAFAQLFSRPMVPQDYTVEANMQRTKT